MRLTFMGDTRRNKLGRVLGILAAVAFSFAASAAEKDDDKKSDEEKMREEAVNLMAQGQREGLSGKFTLLPPPPADKSYPQPIGMLVAKGVGYQVMVKDDAARVSMAPYDKKEVTMLGKIMDKGEKGLFFMTDELQVPSAPPVQKKKRGGL